MSGWKLFFFVAALFNFAAGGPLLVAPEWMLQTLELPVPADVFFHKMTGLLVVCFGGLYGLIATDLGRYKPMVWFGIAGKAGVVVLFTQAWMAGAIPFKAYAVSLGDLAFTLGFIWFVLSYKPNEA